MTATGWGLLALAAALIAVAWLVTIARRSRRVAKPRRYVVLARMTDTPGVPWVFPCQSYAAAVAKKGSLLAQPGADIFEITIEPAGGAR